MLFGARSYPVFADGTARRERGSWISLNVFRQFAGDVAGVFFAQQSGALSNQMHLIENRR